MSYLGGTHYIWSSHAHTHFWAADGDGMKYLKIKSLNGGWVDKDEILLHASFQLLQDFVEGEGPHRNIDWNADRKHARTWREITALYRWWTKARPARRRPLDDRRIKCPPLQFEPIPNAELARLLPYDKKKYRVYDRALRRQSVLDEAWEREDQRNLHRLIDVRGFLWT